MPSTDRSEVCIPFVVRDNSIFVTAQLSNGQSIECQFDTGSFSTFIDQKCIDSFPIVGTEDVTGGLGESIQREIVRLDKFSVGPFSQSPFEVLKETNPQRYCLLGFGFFGDRAFKLDFILNQITVLNPFFEGNELVPSNDLIQFCIGIGEENLLAAFDSGASISAIDSNFINKNKDRFEFIKDLNEGTDITGIKKNVKLYKIKELKIKDVIHKNVQTVAIDFGAIRKSYPNFPEFFLGYNLMKDYVWTFDRENLKWTVY